MKKSILISLFIALTVSTVIIITASDYFNAPLTSLSVIEKSKLEKMNWPADHFFLQRSYPDAYFDIKAYENVLREEKNKISANRSSANNIHSDWTLEGPGNIGGRINTVAVDPNDPNIIYEGNANGGIFKTINGGTSWFPIFDTQAYLAIGCITLDPNNSNIIYVGTGDPNISGYPGIGDGVYKSTDGGNSWVHLGLIEQRIISKIVVDPSNSNTIYAATMGLPFTTNTFRGLYKSTDGGLTWNQILYISDDAGIIDLVINPFDSQTLYAAGWNRIRNNQQSLISGPAAKIYKSTDGGINWVILEGGLPTQDMSRIGLCHSNINSNTVFAVYVDGITLDLQGIYKTIDGGISWISVPTTGLPSDVFSGFGWYFGQIRVNPSDDNELFILSVDLYKTIDGGNEWFMAGQPWYDYSVHADKHDLVFIDANTLLLATDGGLYKSTDRGINFTDIENIPNTQFYRVAVNPNNNEMYYGGAQDNGTLSGNASTINEWERLLGGDGFQSLFDPHNSNLSYAETQNGNLYYSDNGGAFYDNLNDGIDPGDRRSWNMPFIMSNINSSVLYTGTYRIYKMNGAPYDTWDSISGDLTNGNIYGNGFHVITTVFESPLNDQFLYAGTSDGNVWRTLNGGGNWNNITGALPNRYVTDIKSSPANVNTIFVSHSGYKSNEFIPHIHKSVDNGNSWTDISGDLPQFAINDILILEGHDDSIVFVATDGGVYCTLNNGNNWSRVGGNMPLFPVYDIDYNNTTKKLIAGTFGRSLMTFSMDSIIEPIFTVGMAEITMQLKSSVYPSPAENYLILDITGNFINERILINIFSSEGRLVKSLNMHVSKKIEISVEDLSDGIYIVKSIVGNKTLINRFVKLS